MSHLSEAARRSLLRVAREAVAAGLEGRDPCAAAGREEVEEPELRDRAGAFVCLKAGGSLRGCIGTFEPRGPLARTVADMAHCAAFRDPRFAPLAPRELAGLAIEISVLTPLRRIEGPAEVEVGRHGLCIEQGRCRGVLLPQVATEQGWDRETFLAQTCRKAGLPPDAWKRGAELYVFEADVFGEK